MKRLTTIATVLATASPALAQDASQDWELHDVPARKAVIAMVRLNAGPTIVARCIDGDFSILLAGLPPAPERATNRTLEAAFGDEEFNRRTWSVAVDPTDAISDLPAPFARKLREGGRLQIRVPGGAEGGRNLRYDLTLPPSASAIDQVLTRCERPLVDPRDAELDALPDSGLPTNVRWVKPPEPMFPISRYARGYAVLSCLTSPTGALRDCVVESQHPHDGGFGEAALRAARRSEVVQDTPEGETFQPARVVYRTAFMMGGYETEEEREQMRESRRRDRAR